MSLRIQQAATGSNQWLSRHLQSTDLPLKPARRAGKIHIDVTCPKCHSQPETLGHVLNACTPNTGLMRAWHNSILKRLVKAVPSKVGKKFVEQKLRDSLSDLRPDLTIINRQTGEALIVDVTVPFEGCDEAFEKARAEKLSKYHPLKIWLELQDNIPSSDTTIPDDDLTLPVSPEEVDAQLKRLPTQSSPGPDGVPYYIWKYTQSSSGPFQPSSLHAASTKEFQPVGRRAQPF